MPSAEMAALLGRDAGVILAGSGISIWAPTDLPNGMQFTQGTFDALFRTPGMTPLGSKDERFLETWFKEGFAAPRTLPGHHLSALPFEVLMEHCTRHDVLGRLVQQIYDVDRANAVHCAVAALVTSGRVASLLTTNYDRGLESALRAAGSTIPRVVREGDAPYDANVYFKIHGTSDPGAEDTLIYRLRTEGRLPRWKRSLLQKIVGRRVLVIIGYSGVDFDIGPEIGSIRPRVVLWNFRTDEDAERSPGLRRLDADKVPTVRLVGDMRRFLELLGGVPVRATVGTALVSVADELRARLTLPELLLWRSRVLNSMGHARLAQDAVASVPTSPELEFDLAHTRAQALFHAGAYAKSSRSFVAASHIAPDGLRKRTSLLDAADAARCHGSSRRAQSLIERAADGLPSTASWASELQGLIDLKRILLLREEYEAVRLLRVPRLEARVRRNAEPLFVSAARRSLEAGRWFDFQQLSLWADRIGISQAAFQLAGHFAPPPAHDGYRQLGYPVGVAMETCDRARNGSATLDELNWLLALMEDFGANPQAWKLAYASLRSFPAKARRNAMAFVQTFSRCEYTWVKRGLWLLHGS